MLRKASVVLVTLLLTAVALVWLVDFDASELGAAALERAGSAVGMELVASSYRINLVRGLELTDVAATGRTPGVRYDVEMPSMRFEHRVASLFRGPLEIERVVLVEPRVVIVTGLEVVSDPPTRRRRPRSGNAPPSSDAREPAVETPPAPIELELRELELHGAAVSFNDDLSLDGVDVVLESPNLAFRGLTLLHSIDASGTLAIREISLDTFTVRNVVVDQLELERGHLTLTGGAFEVDRGVFETDVELDMNSIPARHWISLEGELNGIPGHISFRGEGFGLDARNLKGSGEWSVPAGRFDDAPLWRLLELTGSAYEATELTFEVASGTATLEGVWIRGTVGLDGTLNLVVSGKEVTGTWGAPALR